MLRRVAVFFLSLLSTAPAILAQEQVVKDPSQSMTASNQKIDASSVSAAAPQVSVVGDTLIFSASAYRLAEDASLEDLLRKIPGIEITGNTVTLYGKLISELRVNGKRYFGGDVSMGLQNISAEMVDKVGAYERESDFARLTGVDDGELVPVLDVKIKSDFMDGWKGRLAGGYGTSNRYVARANLNKVTKKEQSTVLANFNNLPGKLSFTNASRTQLGGGSTGDVHRREAGVTHAENNSKKELDWNVQYQGRTTDLRSLSQSQSIYSNTTSYSCGDNSSASTVQNPKADMRYQWKLANNTTVLLKSAINYSGTRGMSHNYTGNFKKDPFTLSDDPCSLIKAYEPISLFSGRGGSHKREGAVSPFRQTMPWCLAVPGRGQITALFTTVPKPLRTQPAGSLRTRMPATCHSLCILHGASLWAKACSCSSPRGVNSRTAPTSAASMT